MKRRENRTDDTDGNGQIEGDIPILKVVDHPAKTMGETTPAMAKPEFIMPPAMPAYS